MSRFRLTTRPVVLFGVIFLIALVLLLPLRVALGWVDLGRTGFAAREVSGSVWRGSLREAQFGAVPLGDLGAALSPIQLLVGRARVDLAGHSTTTARRVKGAIGVSRHGFGLDDMTASVPTGDVFQPVPLSNLDLDDVSVRFQDGTCQKAEGRVKATLSGDVLGLGLGQGMAGTARCDAGALLLPLIGQAGTEGVAVWIWSTGRYRAELTVQPSDPAILTKLELAGFQRSPKGYLLAIEGKF